MSVPARRRSRWSSRSSRGTVLAVSLPRRPPLYGRLSGHQFFPGVLLIIPYFMVAGAWGLFNLRGVDPGISPSPAILRLDAEGVLHSIPRGMDEAALINGCSRSGRSCGWFSHAAPGIGATALFASSGVDGVPVSLCLASSQSMFPVTVGIASNIGQYQILWNSSWRRRLSSLPGGRGVLRAGEAPRGGADLRGGEGVAWGVIRPARGSRPDSRQSAAGPGWPAPTALDLVPLSRGFPWLGRTIRSRRMCRMPIKGDARCAE